MLHRLMIHNPELWAHLMSEIQRIQVAEEVAMDMIRKHWEDKGFGLFTRCGMTHKISQTNINLASHKWRKHLHDLVTLKFPGATPMCLHASLDRVLKERGRYLNDK